MMARRDNTKLREAVRLATAGQLHTGLYDLVRLGTTGGTGLKTDCDQVGRFFSQRT